MKKSLLLLLSILFLLLTLTGCTFETPTIVVTTYPVKYLVEKLCGDRANIKCIGDDKVIIRSEIVDNYKEIIEDADLFLYMGQVEPYLQIYLDEIKNTKNLDIIDLGSTTSLYPFKRYTNVKVGDSTYTIETDYYEGSVFDDIDIYDTDPYIWLDPVAMTSMANQIRNWLNEKYPEESEYFDQKYEELQTNFALLDSQFELLKNSNSEIKVVTMSPSFGVWQKNYGIQVYPIILSKYGVLPNDKQLEAIKQRIKDDEVEYIFYEPNMTSDMETLYEQLIDELGLQSITISNLSSLSETQINENKDYLQIMYENLTFLESITN